MQRLIDPRSEDEAHAEGMTHEEARGVVLFVRDLAVKLEDGRVSIEEIDQHTTAGDRHLAIRFTPPSNPAFAPLKRMLDRLIDQQGAVLRLHGSFTREELAAVEAAVTPTEVRFPVRHPWQVKPNADGTGGVRSPAIYRAESERGPEIGRAS